MESESLRSLAKRIGVSHTYLSQIKSGKRPASEKIAFMLFKEGISGKQVVSKFNTLVKPSKIPYNESASGCNSAVECLLPKQGVTSSNLATRSRF